ncbi:MAG: CDP-glycerol glycerophosphotransferase family protein [Clostridia bacterium]|nr:CDP-glycerol glycerophosphotransferase family protein [Clostridia bacterium]
MKKPIIYFQFDFDEFFSGDHMCKKGDFDYERDGFGEVEYDLDSVVDRIIEYMKNDCRLKPEYLERIDNYFAFNSGSARSPRPLYRWWDELRERSANVSCKSI